MAQFTGSMTRTSAGTPFITVPSGNIITIFTGSNGQIVLSGSGGSSGGGYPPDYASLTGSRFTGPVTASLGVSASFFAAGATGNGVKPDTGLWRAPYNQSTALPILTVKSAGGVDTNLITFGAGDLWSLGNTSFDVSINSFGLNTISLGNVGVSFRVQAISNVLDLTNTRATFNVPITVNGTSQITLGHSGSTVRSYNAFHRIHELEGHNLTSNATPVTVASFLSGANGRSYMVHTCLQANHVSTGECAQWTMSGFFRRVAGSMQLLRSDAALSSSTTPTLSGTLTSSAGNIIVQATGNTGSFHWGCSIRVQELGA